MFVVLGIFLWRSFSNIGFLPSTSTKQNVAHLRFQLVFYSLPYLMIALMSLHRE